MGNDNKNKSLLKDLAILFTVWGPLLFIIIGGTAWKNGSFDGTVMEQLFPAMFYGFIASFLIVIIFSNLFHNSTTLWIVSAIVVFVLTVIFYILDFTSILIAGAIILGGATLLLAIMKWISNL